jgi:hypothetical protein
MQQSPTEFLSQTFLHQSMCVYLQSTYTNMLSCIAALFSRTAGRARNEVPCIMLHDDRNSIPPALRHEEAPLTAEGLGPLNAAGRHPQTHL